MASLTMISPFHHSQAKHIKTSAQQIKTLFPPSDKNHSLQKLPTTTNNYPTTSPKPLQPPLKPPHNVSNHDIHLPRRTPHYHNFRHTNSSSGTRLCLPIRFLPHEILLSGCERDDDLERAIRHEYWWPFRINHLRIRSSVVLRRQCQESHRLYQRPSWLRLKCSLRQSADQRDYSP